MKPFAEAICHGLVSAQTNRMKIAFEVAFRVK